MASEKIYGIHKPGRSHLLPRKSGWWPDVMVTRIIKGLRVMFPNRDRSFSDRQPKKKKKKKTCKPSDAARLKAVHVHFGRAFLNY